MSKTALRETAPTTSAPKYQSPVPTPPAAHTTVSRAEWLIARKALLEEERELTHLRDRLNAKRLALPRVKVEKDYNFDTAQGRQSLADLFEGRSQLMIYHFMLGPGWGAGCPSCSFLADHLQGALAHLTHHDVSLVLVSRAPLPEIAAYQRRMGWTIPWVSSFNTDFNVDFHVSFTKEEMAGGKIHYNFTEIDTKRTADEMPGLSAFQKDSDGAIYHTYSAYARGLEEMVSTFTVLDRAPLGRNENSTMDFVRRHDEYEDATKAHACCT